MADRQVPVREAFPISADEIVECAWVYVNFHSRALSVLDVTGIPTDYPIVNNNHPDSRILAITKQAFLENAQFVVNVVERERGIVYAKMREREGDEPRSPFTRHAVISGRPIVAKNIPQDISWREVGYNPSLNDTFVDKATGQSVLFARYAKVTSCPVSKMTSIFIPA